MLDIYTKRDNTMKHYIIGDVHGHYDTLMILIERLPKDEKLIYADAYRTF